jgi:hypothetical protein
MEVDAEVGEASGVIAAAEATADADAISQVDGLVEVNNEDAAIRAAIAARDRPPVADEDEEDSDVIVLPSAPSPAQRVRSSSSLSRGISSAASSIRGSPSSSSSSSRGPLSETAPYTMPKGINREAFYRAILKYCHRYHKPRDREAKAAIEIIDEEELTASSPSLSSSYSSSTRTRPTRLRQPTDRYDNNYVAADSTLSASEQSIKDVQIRASQIAYPTHCQWTAATACHVSFNDKTVKEALILAHAFGKYISERLEQGDKDMAETAKAVLAAMRLKFNIAKVQRATRTSIQGPPKGQERTPNEGEGSRSSSQSSKQSDNQIISSISSGRKKRSIHPSGSQSRQTLTVSVKPATTMTSPKGDR